MLSVLWTYSRLLVPTYLPACPPACPSDHVPVLWSLCEAVALSLLRSCHCSTCRLAVLLLLIDRCSRNAAAVTIGLTESSGGVYVCVCSQLHLSCRCLRRRQKKKIPLHGREAQNRDMSTYRDVPPAILSRIYVQYVQADHGPRSSCRFLQHRKRMRTRKRASLIHCSITPPRSMMTVVYPV